MVRQKKLICSLLWVTIVCSLSPPLWGQEDKGLTELSRKVDEVIRIQKEMSKKMDDLKNDLDVLKYRS